MTISTDQTSPRRNTTRTPERGGNMSTVALIGAAVVALLFMGYALSNTNLRGDNSDQAKSVNSPTTQSSSDKVNKQLDDRNNNKQLDDRTNKQL